MRTGLVILAIGTLALAGCGTGEYHAPPGYISTSQEEQALLNLHEAYGTLKPNPDEKAQRAIIEHAKLLCRQLDERTTTVELATAIGKREGIQEPEVVTDFAVTALCPQYGAH